jgi:hypothetical protein
MLITFALLTLAAVTADGPTTVHLNRDQELVYRGRFTDESSDPAAERRACDVEARAFVLATGPAGAEVAFLTVLRAPGSNSDTAVSARLEFGVVDARGRVTLQRCGGPQRLSLDGPPGFEAAGFVELPPRPAAVWDVDDGRRPPREWRVAGDDFLPGVRCLKLVGQQESAEWRHPLDGVPAWRRTETVWLSAATGIVQRLERTIELRNPDGSSRGVLRTEYERVETSALATMTDRRRDLDQCAELDRKLTVILSQRNDVRRRENCAGLVERIDTDLANRPPTPYRVAVLALRRRAESAARGEVPPPAEMPDPPPPAPVIARAAPDFVAGELTSGTALRLARWQGKPGVLLFVRPDSTAAGPTLKLAADLQSRYGDRIHVAVLVVSDEEQARPAWMAFGVPLFAGRSAAELYGASGPSRVVVLDPDGVMRHLGEVGPGVIDAVQRLVGR